MELRGIGRAGLLPEQYGRRQPVFQHLKVQLRTVVPGRTTSAAQHGVSSEEGSTPGNRGWGEARGSASGRAASAARRPQPFAISMERLESRNPRRRRSGAQPQAYPLFTVAWGATPREGAGKKRRLLVVQRVGTDLAIKQVDKSSLTRRHSRPLPGAAGWAPRA